eukprot:scaffold532264_cov14-Prasinocladus_malaysianus.AAC.1
MEAAAVSSSRCSKKTDGMCWMNIYLDLLSAWFSYNDWAAIESRLCGCEVVYAKRTNTSKNKGVIVMLSPQN